MVVDLHFWIGDFQPVAIDQDFLEVNLSSESCIVTST